ncbi:hypothetical protein PMALA_055160 [Plasmodium malariae]|uniref:Uncharacterized protein n=1 Tax=Plasmodium malariae TaxID=5858 RepID=A0A1A8WYW1_PLAMA|nr:hypothetical protein PMALA_055160 [Plasmodium malariae]
MYKNDSDLFELKYQNKRSLIETISRSGHPKIKFPTDKSTQEIHHPNELEGQHETLILPQGSTMDIGIKQSEEEIYEKKKDKKKTDPKLVQKYIWKYSKNAEMYNGKNNKGPFSKKFPEENTKEELKIYPNIIVDEHII